MAEPGLRPLWLKLWLLCGTFDALYAGVVAALQGSSAASVWLGVASGPFMIGIFAIAPEGSGTRYTASARHWTAESMAHHQEMGFAEGWGAVADQLKALCEGG